MNKFEITEENGKEVWNTDTRTYASPPPGMEDAVYQRSGREMVQDLNDYLDACEAAGDVDQSIVAWSLFEAITAVLGEYNPEADQIVKFAARLTSFLTQNTDAEMIGENDERSELTA